jgi:hypothetical protein
MLMWSARDHRAALRPAVRPAFAVPVCRHSGGTGHVIRAAGIREGMAPGESHGGHERSGQIEEGFHFCEPFMVRARYATDIEPSGFPGNIDNCEMRQQPAGWTAQAYLSNTATGIVAPGRSSGCRIPSRPRRDTNV